MSNTKSIKTADMCPLVQEILRNGGSARITVTGTSMYPFFREGLDSVELIQTKLDAVKRGDIILALRSNGQYVLHRVWRKNAHEFYMVGDAQTWIDGPYQENQLIALVSRVWRNDKEIICTNFLWRAAGSIWLALRPFRGIFFRALRRINSLFRNRKA
jgi:signal peptidase